MSRFLQALLVVPALVLAAATAAPADEEGFFDAYRSGDPNFPVAFEYPADWKVMPPRTTEERLTSVQVVAPPSEGIHGFIILTVSVQPLKVAGGHYASADELIQLYKSQLPPGSEPGEATVLGVTAIKLPMRTQGLPPWHGAPSEMPPRKGERVVFERDGQLYELSWLAPEEVAPQAAAAFKRLLRTLALVDESAPPAPAAP